MKEEKEYRLYATYKTELKIIIKAKSKQDAIEKAKAYAEDTSDPGYFVQGSLRVDTKDIAVRGLKDTEWME
jgi:hypothetical protein